VGGRRRRRDARRANPVGAASAPSVRSLFERALSVGDVEEAARIHVVSVATAWNYCNKALAAGVPASAAACLALVEEPVRAAALSLPDAVMHGPLQPAVDAVRPSTGDVEFLHQKVRLVRTARALPLPPGAR
jgi:hypothetical protein